MVFDVTIIGGGIVGLATALQLLRQFPHLKLAIIEKENALATHQTGHNSGVIHSGIYYKPGSLKAKNCVEGVKDLLTFCDENNVSYQKCGKIVVATRPEEISRLEELERRGKANGVPDLEMIGPERLKEIEPHATGLQALYSPQTGIVDFVQVAHAYAKRIELMGGLIFLGQPVQGVDVKGKESIVKTATKEYRTKYLINCAGAYSDQIARMCGTQQAMYQIIPFRGEYYFLKPEKRSLLKGLIYPVPDPKFPFLGVHLTRTIHGEVEAGPNAVLALSKVGYRKTDINPADLWQMMRYKGFWKMVGRYWRMGMYEVYRSFSKKAFVKDLQRLMPELTEEDIVPGGSGVRAQAVKADGTMLDDFAIAEEPTQLHVLNAPSPAATASLAIGKQLAALARKNFDLKRH